MTDADIDALVAFLHAHPPFDSAPDEVIEAAAKAARVRRYARGELVLDAFTKDNDQIWAVVEGRVDVWNDADRISEAPDERLDRGGLFGFSAMLTGRSIGPRAVAAADQTLVARFPGETVMSVFASHAGAEFLATTVGRVSKRGSDDSGYTLVDDLIHHGPMEVAAADGVGEVAARMTEAKVGYAAVRRSDGGLGLITDRRLRQRVLAKGRSPDTPAEEVMDADPPLVTMGSSAAEALIMLLDRKADYVLVTDRDQTLRGVVDVRDFVVSPATVGASLHEQLRRAADVDELRRRTAQVPGMLVDLLDGGLASGRVIAVYSAIVDTICRRSIALVFADHPELSPDVFTWLSLGSNGRRESVPSSDIDAAVAFADSVTAAEINRYRTVFAEVGEVLTGLGLSSDDHGATPAHKLFARTNRDWRAASLKWLAAPEKNDGAIMTSLMVDGRPIHGDPGLPEVMKVFSELRQHRGTMKLLLQESLSKRAKIRSVRGMLTRRDTFDVKAHALLPIVNLARWAALSAGSTVLPTTDRLRAAGGTSILPAAQAEALVEVFGVLQRVRLRYQLRQLEQGRPATDVVDMDRLSAIDRSIITRAVREIAAVQRRMDNVSVYSSPETWTSPATTT